jgi:hypothetical protein
MVLVQNIGMSGYVPLEGVVGLFHFRSDCLFRRFKRGCRYGSECESGFYYLFRCDLDNTDDIDILGKIASFAVIVRFGEFAMNTVVRDVGLVSGYCCAGTVFPDKLLKVFLSMCLNYYLDVSYVFKLSSGDCYIVSSSAWSEYIRMDPDVSDVCYPKIYIEVLGYRKPFPDFVLEDFWI